MDTLLTLIPVLPTPVQLDPIATALLLIMIALQIADGATTAYLFARYPQYTKEKNPLLAPLIARFGATTVMLILKAAACGFTLWLVCWYGVPDPVVWLVFLSAVYAYVVVNNVNGIRKARGWDAAKRVAAP